MVSVKSDVSDPRSGDEAGDSFHHAETRAQNRHQRELLSTHAPAGGSLQGRVDGRRFQGQLTRGLVRDQGGDLVDELLEDFRGRRAVAQQRQLVLHQRVRDDAQRGERGGGVHAAEASNFARMKEYQAVMLRLTRHARDDEDALTDLLNERSRGGWHPAMMSQDDRRITVVFERPSDRPPGAG